MEAGGLVVTPLVQGACCATVWCAPAAGHVGLINAKDPVHLVLLAARGEKPGVVGAVYGEHSSLHALTEPMKTWSGALW